MPTKNAVFSHFWQASLFIAGNLYFHRALVMQRATTAFYSAKTWAGNAPHPPSHLLRPCYKFYTSAKIMLQGSVMTKWIRYCFMGLFVSWIMTDRNVAQHQPAFLSSSILFVRQILSLDFKQDCEHCILSLKKQEMTCVTEVHYIVVGRGANNLEAYLLLYLS